jgi:hypothetical protein
MIKDLLAGGVNGIHLSVMHLVRSHEANPGMVVVLVVPVEEPTTEAPRIGSGANKLRAAPGNARRPTTSVILCCPHRIPDGRRTSTVEAQPAEVELPLPDAAQQFNTGNETVQNLGLLRSALVQFK